MLEVTESSLNKNASENNKDKVTNKKEVTELGKIFEKLRTDARAIVIDLTLGIRSFGTIGLIAIVFGLWAFGGAVIELLTPPTSPLLVWFFVVFGGLLIALGVNIIQRFRYLKNKYSWIFKAEKSLKK